MKKLLIYVPTFEGADNLRHFVGFFLKEASGFESEVHLHINDNGTKNQDLTWIEGCPNISLTRNEENIGAALNFNKVFEFNSGYEFTWVLGDDDFLLPGSIARLVKLLGRPENCWDFICLNTVTFDAKIKPLIISNFIENNEIDPALGVVKSRISDGLIITEFNRLITPEVDEVLLGALMLGVFRTSKVRDISSAMISAGGRLTPYSAYPHAINYAGSFEPSAPSLYDPFIYTFNFWDGGNTWKADYDVVVGLGLLYLIKQYSHYGHLSDEREKMLLQHYLRIGRNSLGKVIGVSGSADERLVDSISSYLLCRCIKYGLPLSP